jgi:DNA-binding transcriptional ArsR family regulator
MPSPLSVTVEVTPRFELFYALQALESTTPQLTEWRREMDLKLPPRLRTSIASVAPSPLIWPLIADSLRDEAPGLTFDQMIIALRSMDNGAFQKAVLSGIFKTRGSVEGLISGRVTLKRTVAAESKAQERLLSLIGLHPFSVESASARVFQRIVSEADSYREEIVAVVQTFWSAEFSAAWAGLEPQMQRSARTMKSAVASSGFAAFSRDRKLPIRVDGESIVSASGSIRIPMSPVAGIHLIPSTFNVAGLWAAYTGSRKRTRFYIPFVDATPAVTAVPAKPGAPAAIADPALLFRALGDTTRYAIASMIATQPMTSAELAQVFGVSKPTISHHVQLLRSANLLIESAGEAGIVLSLNRQVLESASRAAAQEMFSSAAKGNVIRRSRKPNHSE